MLSGNKLCIGTRAGIPLPFSEGKSRSDDTPGPFSVHSTSGESVQMQGRIHLDWGHEVFLTRKFSVVEAGAIKQYLLHWDNKHATEADGKFRVSHEKNGVQDAVTTCFSDATLLFCTLTRAPAHPPASPTSHDVALLDPPQVGSHQQG